MRETEGVVFVGLSRTVVRLRVTMPASVRCARNEVSSLS